MGKKTLYVHVFYLYKLLITDLNLSKSDKIARKIKKENKKKKQQKQNGKRKKGKGTREKRETIKT